MPGSSETFKNFKADELMEGTGIYFALCDAVNYIRSLYFLYLTPIMPFSVGWGKTYEPFSGTWSFFVAFLLSRARPRSRLVSPPRAYLLRKVFFRDD